MLGASLIQIDRTLALVPPAPSFQDKGAELRERMSLWVMSKNLPLPEGLRFCHISLSPQRLGATPEWLGTTPFHDCCDQLSRVHATGFLVENGQDKSSSLEGHRLRGKRKALGCCVSWRRLSQGKSASHTCGYVYVNSSMNNENSTLSIIGTFAYMIANTLNHIFT